MIPGFVHCARSRVLLAASSLLLAACASRAPLVAEFSPERRYALNDGVWLKRATLRASTGSGAHFTDLESARIVEVVPGDRDVLVFSRVERDTRLKVWVELDGATVAAAYFWAQDWEADPAWHVGTGGRGTCAVEVREAERLEGTLLLEFDGRKETARTGVSGPYVYRVSGPFRAEAPSPR